MPVIVALLFFLIWEVAVQKGWLQRFLFPPPSQLTVTFFELLMDGIPVGKTIFDHSLLTLTRVLVGFLMAITLAIPLGLIIGASPILYRLMAPVIGFCRSVATLSLLPLALVWFGIGEMSKIFLISYGCFWVMLSNATAAIRLIDPLLIRAARTMNTSSWRLFNRVILPASLPRLAAGARISLGVGFMVIIGAEMIGTTTGLGALIMEARTFYRPDVTFIGMITIGVFGIFISAGLSRFETLMMPWIPGDERQS